MARPREFETEAVVDRAMQVFWTKGFEATSLDELCAATGLNRSSLYGAFGSKRALYLRALQRYTDNGAARIEALLSAAPARQAFAAFLQGLIDDIVAGPGRRGCFIGNCMAELGRHDRKAAMQARDSLFALERVFAASLEAARGRGELASEADAESIARFLAAGIQGLRLTGKVNPDRVVLEDIAARMLCAAFDDPRYPAAQAAHGRERRS